MIKMILKCYYGVRDEAVITRLKKNKFSTINSGIGFIVCIIYLHLYLIFYVPLNHIQSSNHLILYRIIQLT